jgi:predicted dithiol-disulfide oxidoreductase (DUF899 family)
MHIHETVRADEWVVARQALVEDLTRLRHQLYADPCDLPWVRATPAFAFDGLALAALFGTPEQSAQAWSGMFDKLEGYLRTLN